MDFVAILAKEFNLRPEHVRAVIEMLDAGNTIPFIARYRKEKTGSMDDQTLRDLAERLEYLRNLEKRREEIVKALEEQGVLTDELTLALQKAQTLAELEDIYRPFRPKRRTRATIAKERGLEPLALWLLLQLPKGKVRRSRKGSAGRRKRFGWRTGHFGRTGQRRRGPAQGDQGNAAAGRRG